MAPQLPKSYKAIVLNSPGADFIIKDVPLKEPGKAKSWSKVPGHEIVGDVVSVGEGVTQFKGGERVGGPWHGGHDNTCRACQRGQFVICDNEVINGISRDGGYAEYVILRSEAVVRVPADLSPVETAPLLCAGVTVFNGMRKMHIEQGNLVAVQGLGGLGHLAVQYADKMGYRVVALSHGPDKKDFATKLVAQFYIDTTNEDPAKALQDLGGAQMICATSPNGKSIGRLVGGLAAGGKLLVLGAAGPVEFNTVEMISKAASVHGHPSGHTLDCEEAIQFAAHHGVKCMVEPFPLNDVKKAVDHMLRGKVRFRGVLTME
ncbi:alcohol dehydrogenase [Pleurostoma richardsiae]|uniref:Alcohol dehydrogenase n=1 Tax=Pleurostoma richardsiae TaxID=41990 RepID=A0AA38R7R9_9PEZI|nr:alcohol dehydrogenase [Pleurostoma richardsiae]